jgi:hypothetical protein
MIHSVEGEGIFQKSTFIERNKDRKVRGVTVKEREKMKKNKQLISI